MRLAVIIFGCALALTRIAHGGDPDHLVPVDGHPGEWSVAYFKALRSQLKLHDDDFAQMLVVSGVEGEFALRLHGSKDDLSPKGPPVTFLSIERVFVTYSVADKNIADSVPERFESRDKRKTERIRVSTSTAEIPKELATRVVRLWEDMLLRTRYEEQDVISTREIERYLKVHPTLFQFCVRNAYGETYSPREPSSPRLLVELGDSLINYSKAAVGDRPLAMKQIEDKATALERYLTEHPQT